MSGLGNQDYGRRDPPRFPRDTGTNFADKLRSLGIVRLWTKAAVLVRIS
jgi:serine protease inhibitor